MKIKSVLAALSILGFAIAANAQSFCSSGVIVIPTVGTAGNANPYPSTINVSGLPTVSKVTVELQGLTHTFTGDLDVLLESPSGNNVILASDIGGRANNVNVTFDDSATNAITNLSASGTFRPNNNGLTPDTFPSVSTVSGSTTLATFNGTNPNGAWNLYIVDDTGGDVGTLTQWCINFTNIPPISVTTTSLTDARDGTPYNQAIAATGGVSPYTYNISTGTLPSGITLSASGVLSGTPTASGTFNFTVDVGDSASSTHATQALTLVVLAPLPLPISITTPSLNNGRSGNVYNQALTVTGGVAPYTFSITSGALPPGITISPSGVISGTPAASGTFSFTIEVSDSIGSTPTSQAYTMTVAPAAAPSPANIPTLSEWAMVCLLMIMGLIGGIRLRQLTR